MAAGMREPAEFWARVNKQGQRIDRMATNCWEWMGCTNPPKHYGRLAWRGRFVYAHRLAWELQNGPIPRGRILMHECDNPICVRHLALGTVSENNLDMRSKGRASGGSSPGESNPVAVLTEAKVHAMRERWASGGVTQTRLAKAFGVSQALVAKIVCGEAWAHAGGPITPKRQRRPELTSDQAQRIRSDFAACAGRRGAQQDIAKRFNTSPQVINQILRGKHFA